MAILTGAFGIEFSQLYHAEWIDNIRATTLGSLILGHGFLLSDFICYSVGITIGGLSDFLVFSQLKIAMKNTNKPVDSHK